MRSALRRLLIVAFSLLLALQPAGAWTLVGHVALTPSGTSGGTTTAINTTGANFCAFAVAYFTTDGTPNLSDNKGNSLNSPYLISNNSPVSIALFESLGLTVGAGHTFTISGVDSSLAVACFSGAISSGVTDQTNTGTSTSSATVQPGSITSTVNNTLIIAAVGISSSSASQPTINDGFNHLDFVPFTSGQFFGVDTEYLIQSTAAAINPTWTFVSANNLAALQANFKPAPAAATGGSSLPLTGVGHFFPANDDFEPANDNHGGKVLHWLKH